LLKDEETLQTFLLTQHSKVIQVVEYILHGYTLLETSVEDFGSKAQETLLYPLEYVL
jgi:hypothetical protein